MKLNVLVASGLVLLAGCSQQPAPPQSVPATPDANATAPAPRTFPADFKLDTPIPAAAIRTELALVGTPAFLAKDDVLLFDVKVTNAGTVPLVSAGKAPVQLAINLAGPEGVDKAPGKRLAGRAMLPMIAPGKDGIVKARVRAEAVLGQTVRVELFQEGVGWFGRRYNQPTLDIGTFQRCEGAARSLCDSSGSPVAPPASAPAAGR